MTAQQTSIAWSGASIEPYLARENHAQFMAKAIVKSVSDVIGIALDPVAHVLAIMKTIIFVGATEVPSGAAPVRVHQEKGFHMVLGFWRKLIVLNGGHHHVPRAFQA
jgi:hypothetical protein